MNPLSNKAFLSRNIFTLANASGGAMISTHPLAAKKARPPTLRNRNS